jgi:hypothetical protein
MLMIRSAVCALVTLAAWADAACWAPAKYQAKLAHRPTSNNFLGLTPLGSDLINRLVIPLSAKFTEKVISGLIKAAKEIRDALTSSPPTGSPACGLQSQWVPRSSFPARAPGSASISRL